MLFISRDNNIELVTETRIPWNNNKDLLIVFVVWTLLSVDPFLNRFTWIELSSELVDPGNLMFTQSNISQSESFRISSI